MSFLRKVFDFSHAPERVYVLGAGPAGLLAAHAAKQCGYEVAIFSAPDERGMPKKSDLFGCQYLHSRIFGLDMGPGKGVRYTLSGSADKYREKVYGGAWDGNVSPDEYGPEHNHLAWDLRKAYDRLWSQWAERIVPANIFASTVDTYKRDQGAFVVSTIPVPALCQDIHNHKFQTQNVWALGSLDEEDGRMPYCAPDMKVECDGTSDRGWYRAATVFGYSTLEWPGHTKPPIAGVASVSKPLSTDCTCHTGPRWLRVGRYGEWRKGVLVHTAYEKTLEWLP